MISELRAKISASHFQIFIIGVILFLYAPISIFAEELPVGDLGSEQDLEEELEYLQAETYVITASRVMEEINKAPSSISVVTAKQMREMGARDLKDVIETVVGYDYKYNTFGSYTPVARKQYAAFGNKYLFMVNNHSLNENYKGGAEVGNMPLDNVKRIEFIRGPGSALYGANAFAGVVNIITKEADDVDGLELTARGGSYDTQQYNVLFGKEFKGLETVINFNYFDTDGHAGEVTSDGEDFFDEIYGTDVSKTPGGMNTYVEQYDGALTLKYKGFAFDGKYVDRSQGLTLDGRTLDYQSYGDEINYYINLKYEGMVWKNLGVSAKIYRNHFEFSGPFLDVPEGAFRPWLGNTPAPYDLIGDWRAKNDRTGFEAQVNYALTHNNTIVSGISFEEMEQYDVETYANYLYDGTIFPSVQNISDVQNHNQDATREFKAIFLEDIWDITDNFRLTFGGRYDDYSDFGGHFSPRAGITWEYIPGYDLKLLYGHAFRAPSFVELYGGYGNPDIDPETVDTYEISLGAQFTSSFSGRTTFYRSDYKDGISYKSVGDDVQLINYVEEQYKGVELELKYDFRRGSYLAVNYTYQTTDDPDTNESSSVLLPTHKGNIIANIRLNKYLNFNTYCHFRDGYKRAEDDPRDDMKGQAIVNATLIAKKFLKRFQGLELRASVYNIFDEDYTMPTGTIMIPGDIPMPGRNYMLGIRYAF